MTFRMKRDASEGQWDRGGHTQGGEGLIILNSLCNYIFSKFSKAAVVCNGDVNTSRATQMRK